jgi:hypothetical protein
MRVANLSLIAALLLGSAAHAGESVSTPSLDRFSWLAGHWISDNGKQQVDEFWSAPAPDMLIGMSRTLRDGKTVTFEFLRIAARDDGVFYIAQPRGRPPVEFRLQSYDGQQAVFANPGHADHLQRIVYRHNPDDSLVARVEGSNDGKRFAEDYSYRRAEPQHRP